MFEQKTAFLTAVTGGVLLIGLFALGAAERPAHDPASPQIDTFVLMSKAADLPEQVIDSPF
jgi:hypothetical protein